MSATIAQESARLSSVLAKPVLAKPVLASIAKGPGGHTMTAPVHEQVAFGEARGRWVLLAAVWAAASP